jgi:hypothetical protein
MLVDDSRRGAVGGGAFRSRERGLDRGAVEPDHVGGTFVDRRRLRLKNCVGAVLDRIEWRRTVALRSNHRPPRDDPGYRRPRPLKFKIGTK